MSTARGAKLKAEYNRVRTSTSLKGNDMWTNTIGMEQHPQAGSNAAVEASIYAPSHGGGGKRAERQDVAQKLIKAVGYNPSVTDYQGLLDLAKTQGSLGEGVRGACKRCGGLGHMTRQCTNFVTGHTAAAGTLAAASGVPMGDRGLLPDPGDASDLDDLLGSSSSSSSDDEAAKERKHKKSKTDKEKKRKEKDKKRKDKKRRRKEAEEEEGSGREEGKRHRKDKKHKKHKKSKRRRSSTSSTSDSG